MTFLLYLACCFPTHYGYVAPVYAPSAPPVTHSAAPVSDVLPKNKEVKPQTCRTKHWWKPIPNGCWIEVAYDLEAGKSVKVK